MLAPIVLFVYNRPGHARKTLESLEKNDLSEESELFIFADGPKENASKEQREKIEETRKIIREKNWCGKVSIIEREKNMGLADSVIAGVAEIINKLGKIIVLEDDLILSKNFLKYMNGALDKFEKDGKVMQISGYMFPVEISTEADAFFLPFTTSWGWATWKRTWDFFDPLMEGIGQLEKDRSLRKKFDLDNSYPYYNMLKSQQKGNVDSWAIRFYLSVFLKKGMTLYPKKTLVNNAGFDGSGIHCGKRMEQNPIDDYFAVSSMPESAVIDEKNKKEVFYLIRRQNNLFKRSWKIIMGIIKPTC